MLQLRISLCLIFQRLWGTSEASKYLRFKQISKTQHVQNFLRVCCESDFYSWTSHVRHWGVGTHHIIPCPQHTPYPPPLLNSQALPLIIDGINQLINGNNLLINRINRLIDDTTPLINGLTRLIRVWGPRPGPPAIDQPSKASNCLSNATN